MSWFVLVIAVVGLLYGLQYVRKRRRFRGRSAAVDEPAMPNPTLQVDMLDTLTPVEAQQLALAPKTPFKVLLDLAGQFPHKVAENPRFVKASQQTPEVLETVREEDRPVLFSCIVSYSGTSARVLLRLAALFPDEVLANPSFQIAAISPETPIDLLLKIARHLPHKVAENPTFIKLSRQSPNFLINMPESDRHLLLQHAAGNQNTSIELLIKLLGDFPREVQGNLLFRNLLAEAPELQPKIQALDLARIAYLDAIPEIFIEAIAKTQSRLLHKALLDMRSNGYDWSCLSQEAVTDIMPDVKVRHHLASSLDASIEILLKLATEFPQEVADNPMFMLLFLEDPSILQRMHHDDRARVLSHKNLPAIFSNMAKQFSTI
jgi:hypothetical protein